MSTPVIAVCAVWLAACGLLVLVLHRASRARQPVRGVVLTNTNPPPRTVPVLLEPEVAMARYCRAEAIDAEAKALHVEAETLKARANTELANNWNRLMRELQQ